LRLNLLFINSITMYGGGEVWLITAMKEFIRRGHNVTLICRPDAKILHYAEQNNIDAITLKMRGDVDPFTILKLVGILRKKKIDIILTNVEKELRISGIAAIFTGVKAVISRKGVDLPIKNRLQYRFTHNMLATVIVANSQSTKKTLLKNAPWLNQDKISVIYNGIDPELFSIENTRDLRDELGIPQQFPLIGFVGRLNVQKGIVYILEAFEKVFEKIPSAQLLMAGTGDLSDEIETIAKKKGFSRNIHLIGFRDDIPNVMRTIDLLILPSVWEGFGIVLIEAMAAEKPCVITNISSMPEIVIDGQTGIVVPSKDANKLADAIINLIRNPSLAKKMGCEGKKLVQNKFTLQKMISRYEQLFYEYIDS